jgi:aspartate kinase
MKESTQPIQIFKFGGASVKDAAGLLNVASILKMSATGQGRILVVVSAMGKTTNALEEIVQLACKKEDFTSACSSIIEKHVTEAKAALSASSACEEKLQVLGDLLTSQANAASTLPFDEAYDQIVSLGEVLSSQVLYCVLKEHLPSVALLDARRLIKTDSTFRSPQVEGALTQSLIEEALTTNTAQVLVVQGFIGSD